MGALTDAGRLSPGLGESCHDDLTVADSMRTVLLTLPEIPYSNNKKLMAAALKLIGKSGGLAL